MKTFIVALCVFALLLVGITINFSYINRVMRTMSAELAAMSTPETAKAHFQRLEELWKSNRPCVGISVPFAELRDMDECLAQMRVALQEDDETELWMAHALATETVEHMGRLERFSWECLL